MKSSFRPRALGVLVSLSMLAGHAVWAQGGKSPDFAAVVASPDRSEADRQTDQRRQPARMLAFTGVENGMKVLDMGAGAGYSTELMARSVGPNGMVYGQNPADLPARAKE